jgi:hypothetical protein
VAPSRVGLWLAMHLVNDVISVELFIVARQAN